MIFLLFENSGIWVLHFPSLDRSPPETPEKREKGTRRTKEERDRNFKIPQRPEQRLLYDFDDFCRSFEFLVGRCAMCMSIDGLPSLGRWFFGQA